jgi:hypothetical protein
MTPRRRALVAAPLAVALLVAVALLWSRGEPSRQGGFCTGATVEVTNLLRRTERRGNLDRDQAGHLAEALGRLELLDGDRLTAGAPSDLADATATIREQLDDHQRAVAAAERSGSARPDPPPELSAAVGDVLATYYATCI